MLGTAAGCGRIRGMKRDSRQYRAAMEWQRRVLGPGERTLSPVCVGLGWDAWRGAPWWRQVAKGEGSPGCMGRVVGGGGRRERTGLRLNAGKRLGRLTVEAAMRVVFQRRWPHMLSAPYSSPLHMLFSFHASSESRTEQ